jgi:hypothetical protein
MDKRKLERVVFLCSADDVRRINRYCDETRANRSVYIRDTILTNIRKWEKRKGYHDAEPIEQTETARV